MDLITRRLLERLIESVIKRPYHYLFTALTLTVLSLFIIVNQFEIRSDIADILPENAKSVVDTLAISDRMGSIQSLIVIVEVPELQALSDAQKEALDYEACINDLGEGKHLLAQKPPIGEHLCDNPLVLFTRSFVRELETEPSVGSVAFHHDKSFFEQQLLLYASAEELEAAYDNIDAQLTEARRQSGEYKACLITSDDASECEALAPSLERMSKNLKQEGTTSRGLGAHASDPQALKAELLARYQETELAQIPEMPIYQLADGAWIIRLEVRYHDAMTSLKSFSGETEIIEAIISRLDAKRYHKGLKVVYGGGLKDMQTEYQAVIDDVARSIAITILSIFALMAIFFRSARSALRIFIPLIMSNICALGITFLTIGYLNLITAFIFAILIGLGIDFGIHILARYRREVANGQDVIAALRCSVTETGRPILLGGLTTSAAFFILMLGSFRGFTQFGFVAGIGVLLSLFVMLSVMPALVIISERIRPSKAPTFKLRRPIGERTVKKFNIVIVALSLIALSIGFYEASQVPKIQFEENFHRLKLKPSAIQSSAERYVNPSSRHSSPAYALHPNTDHVLALKILLERNREYKNFHYYRRLMIRIPHAIGYLDDVFGEILPDMGQARSIPVFAALARIIPDPMLEVVPLFASYGRDKSLSLQQDRIFALEYPKMARWISDQFFEVLEVNSNHVAINRIVWMQDFLPPELWEAIPTQRGSQQLNTISDSASIFSYLPGTVDEQIQRLEIIARIAERTNDRNLRFLPQEERDQIVGLRHFLVDKSIDIDSLPEWVKLQFKEIGPNPLPPRAGSGVDYAFGNLSVLYQATSTYSGYEAQLLSREARSIHIDDERLTVATGAFVYADMLTLIKTDGIQTAGLALIALLLIVFLQERKILNAIIITLPVVLGVCITLAIMTSLNLKLGLFNVIMLPVTLGIGIDGSIYLFQRYHALGRGSILESIRDVGGPVFMSSATTLVGFGGMIFSQHMGLNTIGQIAIIGISICFLTTFLIQPGLVILAEMFKLKGCIPAHEFTADR